MKEITKIMTKKEKEFFFLIMDNGKVIDTKVISKKA